jgi:hypothetical protein
MFEKCNYKEEKLSFKELELKVQESFIKYGIEPHLLYEKYFNGEILNPWVLKWSAFYEIYIDLLDTKKRESQLKGLRIEPLSFYVN